MSDFCILGYYLFAYPQHGGLVFCSVHSVQWRHCTSHAVTIQNPTIDWNRTIFWPLLTVTMHSHTSAELAAASLSARYGYACMPWHRPTTSDMIRARIRFRRWIWAVKVGGPHGFDV